MEILKWLFGTDDEPSAPRSQPRRQERTPDEQAIARYRYLLHTAPPETIEEAHAEAFAKLTSEQRRLVLQELDQTLTPSERASTTDDEAPRSLARLATRAEVREPGTLERTWSSMPAGGRPGAPDMGNRLMGNFLGTIAGVMLGSTIADAFLSDGGVDQDIANEAGAGAPESLDSSDAGFDETGVGETGLDAFDGLGEIGGFDDFGGDF